MTSHKQETHKQEHIPHNLIVDLKHDVEALQKKLTHPDAKAHELILEIESLKDAVHQLNVIFEKALNEMKEEDLTKNFKIMLEKVNTVAAQNETIAQGMVALSDKVDTFMTRQLKSVTAGSQGISGGSGIPLQHSMGAPAMSGRMAPRPEMSMSSMMSSPEPVGFPPPPPSSGKKRVGLF